MQATRLRDAYTPMIARAAPLKTSASWVSMVIVIAVLWYGFQFIFVALFSTWTQSPHIVSNPALIDDFIDGSTAAAVRWNLAAFAIYTAILMFMVRRLHRIGLRDLIGAIRPAWRQFWHVSLYLSPLFAFLVLPSAFAPDAVQQFSVITWLTLLPAILPLLFVQISAEELVFRGYLQGHLAALCKHPIIWIGVPSFLFGLVHFDPTAPAYSAWAYVAWATCLGLVCADLTARSGTLGPALAVHFVNNIGALVILAADDWLYGAALFVWPTYGLAWEPFIPYEALMLFTVWLTARLALRR
jgi:membrane protease YdiL (CAAX protease family)